MEETVCSVSVVISDVFTLVETEGIICEVIHDIFSLVEVVELYICGEFGDAVYVVFILIIVIAKVRVVSGMICDVFALMEMQGVWTLLC